MYEIQPYSYHCHTDFSDGKDTIAEMARRAKEIGFCELGISDHLIVHKNMRQNPSWQYMEQRRASYIYNDNFKTILDKYRRHCDEIRAVAKQKNIKIYVGFEVDYFPYDGWEEELKWFMSQLDADYYHTGNHFFCDEKCENIINMTYFTKICTNKEVYKSYIERHFEVLRRAVESKMFRFLAHPDYLRRFCGGEYRPDLFMAEKTAILDALAKTGTAMELSTKGLRKIDDFYPDFGMLQAAVKRDITLVISDDAHCVGELGMDFERAEQALQKAGAFHRLKF